MSSRFSHVMPGSGPPCFSSLNDAHSADAPRLLRHPLLGPGAASPLALVDEAAVSVGCKYLLQTLLSVLWGINLEVELLDPR